MEDDAVEHGADVLEGLVGGSERLEPSVQIVSVLLVRAGRVRVCLLVILEGGETGHTHPSFTGWPLIGDVTTCTINK